MPAASHHGEVDTGFATLNLHGEDIDITVKHVVHRLLMQHVGERRNLIAELCRQLELKAIRMGHHA